MFYSPAPCFKVIPLAYEESLSYYEQLTKLINKVNEIIETYSEADSTVVSNTQNIQKLQESVENLKNTLEGIENGEATELYEESLKKYIDANLKEIVSGIVKYVTFGLTNEGKFCAYIPETWEFLAFDTIIDPNSDFYGHLVMRY